MPADQVTVFLDDDEHIVEAYREGFRALGYLDRAEFVTTIGAADAALGRGRVGHLVSDWKMPGRDGISYLESVRQARPALRLSLLTAYSDELRNGRSQRLKALRIEVHDKQMLFARGTLWLVRLAVPDAAGPAPAALPLPPTTDSLALLRLEKEALEVMNDEKDLAMDLLAELGKIEDKETASIYGLADAPVSVNDLVAAVRGMTDLGRELVQLHGEVRRGGRGRPLGSGGRPG